MSKSSRRRMSRLLVATVAVALGIGSCYWMYSLGQRSSASADAQRKTPAAVVASGSASADASANAAKAAPAAPAPLVMETPTSRPAADHAPIMLSAMETTSTGISTGPAVKAPAGEKNGSAGASPSLAGASPSQAGASPSQAGASPSQAGASPSQAGASPSHISSPTHPLTQSPAHPRSPTPLAASTQPASLASITISAAPLADAKAKADAGQLLEARDILEAALQSGRLSAADVKSDKLMLNQINDTVVFSSRRFPDDKFGGSMTVPPGGVLAKIARSHDITPELIMRLNGITNPRRLRAGQTLKIVTGPFNAIVYKRAFTLEIWLGQPNGKQGEYITSFPVGLGKDDSTPTGTWAIENKLKNPAYYSPRGGGVIDADDPKNPLGEYWLGLTGTEGQAVGKESYGIHGTIDPTSIGKQDSMGCIRLANENIERVYELLVQGKSTVTVAE